MTIEDIMKAIGGTFLADILEFALERGFESRKTMSQEFYDSLDDEICDPNSLEQICREYVWAKNREILDMLRSGTSVHDERILKAFKAIYRGAKLSELLTMDDSQFIFINPNDLESRPQETGSEVDVSEDDGEANDKLGTNPLQAPTSGNLQ